jgi:hypothetical protein
MPQPDKKRSAARQRYASDKNVPIFGMQQQQQQQDLKGPELFIETAPQGSGAAPVSYSFGNLAPRSPDEDKFLALQNVVSGARTSIDFFSRFMTQLDKNNAKDLQEKWDDSGKNRRIFNLAPDDGSGKQLMLDTADQEIIDMYTDMNKKMIADGKDPLYSIEEGTPEERVARFRKMSGDIKGRGFNFGYQRDRIISDYSPEIERDYAQRVNNRAEAIVKSSVFTPAQKMSKLNALMESAPADVRANIQLLVSGLETDVQSKSNAARIAQTEGRIISNLRADIEEYKRRPDPDLLKRIIGTDANVMHSDQGLYAAFDVTPEFQGILEEFEGLTDKEQQKRISEMDSFSEQNFSALINIMEQRDILLADFRTEIADQEAYETYESHVNSAQAETTWHGRTLRAVDVLSSANDSSKTNDLPVSQLVANAYTTDRTTSIDSVVELQYLEGWLEDPNNPMLEIDNAEDYTDNAIDIMADNLVMAYTVKTREMLGDDPKTVAEREEFKKQIKVGLRGSLGEKLDSWFSAHTKKPVPPFEVSRDTTSFELGEQSSKVLFNGLGLNTKVINNQAIPPDALEPFAVLGEEFVEPGDDDLVTWPELASNIFDIIAEGGSSEETNEALDKLQTYLSRLNNDTEATSDSLQRALTELESNIRKRTTQINSYSRKADEVQKAAEDIFTEVGRTTIGGVVTAVIDPHSGTPNDIESNAAFGLMVNGESVGTAMAFIPTQAVSKGNQTRDQYYSPQYRDDNAGTNPVITIGRSDSMMGSDGIPHEREGQLRYPGDMAYGLTPGLSVLESFLNDLNNADPKERRAMGTEFVEANPQYAQFFSRGDPSTLMFALKEVEQGIGLISRLQDTSNTGAGYYGPPESGFDAFQTTSFSARTDDGTPVLNDREYASVVKSLSLLESIHKTTGGYKDSEFELFQEQKDYLLWLLNPNRPPSLTDLGDSAVGNSYIMAHYGYIAGTLVGQALEPTITVSGRSAESGPLLERFIADNPNDPRRPDIEAVLGPQPITTTSAEATAVIRDVTAQMGRLMGGIKNIQEFMDLSPRARDSLTEGLDVFVDNLWATGNVGGVPILGEDGIRNGAILGPLAQAIVEDHLRTQGNTQPTPFEVQVAFSELVNRGQFTDASLTYHGKYIGVDAPAEIRAMFALPSLMLEMEAKGLQKNPIYLRAQAAMIVSFNDPSSTLASGGEEFVDAPIYDPLITAPVFANADGEMDMFSPYTGSSEDGSAPLMVISKIPRVYLPGYESHITGQQFLELSLFKLASATVELSGGKVFDSKDGVEVFTSVDVARMMAQDNDNVIRTMFALDDNARRKMRAGQTISAYNMDDTSFSDSNISIDMTRALNQIAVRFNEIVDSYGEGNEAAGERAAFTWLTTTYQNFRELAPETYTVNPSTGEFIETQGMGGTRSSDAIIGLMRSGNLNYNQMWSLLGVMPRFNQMPGSFGSPVDNETGRNAATSVDYMRYSSPTVQPPEGGIAYKRPQLRSSTGIRPSDQIGGLLAHDDAWLATSRTPLIWSGDIPDKAEDRMKVALRADLEVPTYNPDGTLKTGYDFEKLAVARRSQRIKDWTLGASKAWIASINGSEAPEQSTELSLAFNRAAFDAFTKMNRAYNDGSGESLSTLEGQLVTGYAILSRKDQILEDIRQSKSKLPPTIRDGMIRRAEEIFTGLEERLKNYELNVLGETDLVRPSFSEDGTFTLGYFRGKNRIMNPSHVPNSRFDMVMPKPGEKPDTDAPSRQMRGHAAQWMPMENTFVDPAMGFYGMRLYTSSGSDYLEIPMFLRDFNLQVRGQ